MRLSTMMVWSGLAGALALLVLTACNGSGNPAASPRSDEASATEAARKGNDAYDRKDYAEALRWYREAADGGDTWSQMRMGWLANNGWGRSRDYDEALRWYRKAAEQNDATAQNNIGVFYQKGLGVTRDDAGALRWFILAANGGDAGAKDNLGLAYEAGRGVARDYAAAMRWYREASDGGNPKAPYRIGLLYAQGRGVTQDVGVARAWIELAADRGYPEAQGWLAGQPTAVAPLSPEQRALAPPPHPAIASNAAKAPLGPVAPEIAENTRKGDDAEQRKNYAEALDWYRKAADLGDPSAQYRVAVLYGEGQGVERNLAAAHRYMRKAAVGGQEAALDWFASHPDYDWKAADCKAGRVGLPFAHSECERGPNSPGAVGDCNSPRYGAHGGDDGLAFVVFFLFSGGRCGIPGPGNPADSVRAATSFARDHGRDFSALKPIGTIGAMTFIADGAAGPMNCFVFGKLGHRLHWHQENMYQFSVYGHVCRKNGGAFGDQEIAAILAGFEEQ